MFMAAPAYAQFGTIFGDPPPRPPRDVGRPQQQQRPAPAQRQPQSPMVFPGQEDDDDDPNEPPAQPQPPPMSQPPSARPGRGTIQTQPLAPPPGINAPPVDTRRLEPQPQPVPGQPQQAAPAQPLPGVQQGQRQPRGAPQPANPPPAQPANTAPQPGDEIVVQPPEQKLTNPTAVFSGLDKITGRTISFDVAINETVQFGALQVTPRVCYTRPPTETPNTDAFVAVDEVTLQGEVRRIFTGWMFAASPGLHAVEHPIYDVWLTDCKGASPPVTAEAPKEEQPAAKPAAPAKPQQQRRRTTSPQSPNFLSPFR